MDEKEKRALGLVLKNWEDWAKKNERRIKLVEDLSLDCSKCQSDEAVSILAPKIDINLKHVFTEADKVNRLNQAIWKKLPKPPSQDCQQEAEKAFKKFTTHSLGDLETLQVKIKPDKLTKEPFEIIFKKNF